MARGRRVRLSVRITPPLLKYCRHRSNLAALNALDLSPSRCWLLRKVEVSPESIARADAYAGAGWFVVDPSESRKDALANDAELGQLFTTLNGQVHWPLEKKLMAEIDAEQKQIAQSDGRPGMPSGGSPNRRKKCREPLPPSDETFVSSMATINQQLRDEQGKGKGAENSTAARRPSRPTTVRRQVSSLAQLGRHSDARRPSMKSPESDGPFFEFEFFAARL